MHILHIFYLHITNKTKKSVFLCEHKHPFSCFYKAKVLNIRSKQICGSTFVVFLFTQIYYFIMFVLTHNPQPIILDATSASISKKPAYLISVFVSAFLTKNLLAAAAAALNSQETCLTHNLYFQ